MAVTITDDQMTSDLVEDHAVKNHQGHWTITGPLVGHQDRTFTRNQAITAMTLAEHLATWGAYHLCENVTQWSDELTLLCPASQAKQVTSETPPHVRCLYCGSDEVFDTIVTIDERTSEHAYECADCHGVWAQ